jgi:phosphoglycolate phosphatase
LRPAGAAAKPNARRERPVRAVLWDLDGTLTDSVRFVVDTANAVITSNGGAALEFERVGALSGLPLEEIFRLAWPTLTADDAARYRIEYRAIYERVAIPATKLYRGARSTLRAFHAAGLLQATVTGKRAADCERILRGLGIKDDIEVYLGGDSALRPKPAPDLAQFAMARLSCMPDEAVVIGDSTADIEMGRAAGAHTIQVLWGFARGPLPGAERVVSSWAELRAAVLDLARRPRPILRGRGPLRS